MPWCDLFQTDGAPPSVERVLRDLNARVSAALTQIGHPTGFTFGRILGTPVENLYAALKVELSYTDAWLHGRPRPERLSVDRSNYNAPPTRSPGRSHRDYQLASDLLRALCWQALRANLPDDNLLNLICRNFADGWLFGHPAHFARKLDEYHSIFGIHTEWDIPLSALAAFTAKLRQDEASVDTLFLIRGPYDVQANAVHVHRLGVRSSTMHRLDDVHRLLRSVGNEPTPGSRSMQFWGRSASNDVSIVNVSAGMATPLRKDGSASDRQAHVLRFVFATVPRLPTSVRGMMN